MGLYVLLTAVLHQKGSAESKPLDDDDAVDEDPRFASDKQSAPWPVRRGGWILKLYEHSLSIALLSLFVASFLLHAASGAREYSRNSCCMAKLPSPCSTTWQRRSSGSSRFRIGRASFSPSSPWSFSQSSCASAARPSRSPFARAAQPDRRLVSR